MAGVAGSLLGIRPVITLKQGEIFPSGIGRSRKNTTNKAIDLLVNYLKEQTISPDKFSVCIGFGYDRKEAEEFMTDVPEWAKSTRTTPTVVEKTTKMAFYDLRSSDAMVVSYRQSGFAHQIHPSECEVIRPDLPEHLYLFAPANEHVSFAFTYDMSCSSVMTC